MLYLAWPDRGMGPLVLVALVPWLFVIQSFWKEEGIRRPLGKTFWYSWITFALFNGLTGWWISLAHWSGLAAVVFIAASLEAFLMSLWVWTMRQIGEKRGFWAFPFFWLIHEWVLNTWDMEWPWLKMGYAFADMPTWIQWYSLTGVYGGTFWVLLVNLSIFIFLRNYLMTPSWKGVWKPILTMAIPLIISHWMYYSYQEQGEEVEIVVVQPNIEPYKEKFELPIVQQLQIFFEEAEKLVRPETDYLIGPETMIPQGLNEDRLETEPLLQYVKRFRDAHPDKLHLIFGINSVRIYDNAQTNTARANRDGSLWYDVFNTAVQLSEADSVPVYHKSKLVVAAEKMPFIDVLEPLLGDIVIDLGGMVGTNRTQKEREVFYSDDGDIAAAPIICWEAEFSSFIADFVRQGANILFIITNDGWWGDSEGHRQHLHYARVRAIETRRSIARSANTGISAFINQRGDLLQTLGWEERGALRGVLKTNEKESAYVRFGDVLIRLTFLLFPLFLLYGISKRLRRKED